jgi:hypothetical protein
VYTSSRAAANAIFTIGNEASGRIIFFINTSSELVYSVYLVGDTNLGGSVPLQSWVHIAFVRSSTTVTAYINGVATGTTGTLSGTVGQSSAFYIGSSASGGNPLTGYISNLRVVNSAVYTTGFTPPTSPVTAISGTQLLCNFTNAGIFDNTGKNNLETVADAQIDTTTKKYGTGSMEFDGTDDVLTFPPTPDLNLGTGDFTIECWVNQSSNSSYKMIYSATGNQGDWNTGSRGFMIYLLNGVLGISTADTGSTNGSGALSLNTWYHIAVVKNGASFKGYIDGVLNLTRTNSSPVGSDTAGALIGAQDLPSGSPRNEFVGFIDDFRITKGVARYTAAFTAPTKAFPDQ